MRGRRTSYGTKVGSMMAMAATNPSTLAAIGPTQSIVDSAGTTPRRLTRPKVGLRPKIPQHAAGMRIEPPVSVPIAKSARPAATAAADPLEDPPGIRVGYLGFGGVPPSR